MHFGFTDEQSALQRRIREFVEKEIKPGAIERDESRIFPYEIISKLAAQGYCGLPVPKEYGGQGKGYQELAIVIEEISKVDVSVAVAISVNISLYGGTLLYADATPEQLEEYLHPVVKGEKIGCFALTEPSAGSDVSAAQTMAVEDGYDYVINGSKCFITNGSVADYYAVYAYTDKELGPSKSMACFIVPRETEGLVIGQRHNTSGIRSAQICELSFQDMRVPKKNRIAAPGKGFKLAMKTLGGGRIGVAAQALGIAEGAFDAAKKHMMERVQFGRPISKFQYPAFRMAELDVEIDNAWYLTYRAAWEKDHNIPGYNVSASKAKFYSSDVAMHTTTEAVQFMGGAGYMQENEVERMMRDAKITQIYEGTNEIQKLIISGSLFPR